MNNVLKLQTKIRVMQCELVRRRAVHEQNEELRAANKRLDRAAKTADNRAAKFRRDLLKAEALIEQLRDRPIHLMQPELRRAIVVSATLKPAIDPKDLSKIDAVEAKLGAR